MVDAMVALPSRSAPPRLADRQHRARRVGQLLRRDHADRRQGARAALSDAGPGDLGHPEENEAFHAPAPGSEGGRTGAQGRCDLCRRRSDGQRRAACSPTVSSRRDELVEMQAAGAVGEVAGWVYDSKAALPRSRHATARVGGVRVDPGQAQPVDRRLLPGASKVPAIHAALKSPHRQRSGHRRADRAGAPGRTHDRQFPSQVRRKRGLDDYWHQL